jgi:RNA polymerase sigma-70 factor (ECF subfamily)
MSRKDDNSAEANNVTKAFHQIYRQEISYIWNCLRRLGVDERDLEDKAHDVFVTFYRRQGDFDSTRPVRPWLSGIAARVALDHNRLAYKKREILFDEIDAVSTVLDPEKAMERFDAQHLLLAALNGLDPDRRSVFVLHDVEGHSMPKVAEMTDVPINTLYSRLRLAREYMTATVQRLLSKRSSL